MSQTKQVKQLDRVIIRFAGDSGDGMQLTGDRFTQESAVFGNDLVTLPNFPAEIRAPQGTIPGVSSFQIHFADHDILTAGDRPDVLVAMNPAALKANLGDLPKGATIIVDTHDFTTRNLQKAGYEKALGLINRWLTTGRGYVSYEYDAAGRLARETDADGVAVDYAADVQPNAVTLSTTDAYGAERAGFTATTSISRKEFGIDIEMGFGAGNQLVDRGISRILGQTFGQRLRRQIGRTQHAVDPPAQQRNGKHGHAGDQPGAARGCGIGGAAPLSRVETQDAAADLGTRLLGLSGLYQAARHVAIKLGKLIAIDFEVVIAGRRHALHAAGERQKHRQASAQREDCGYDPEQHGSPIKAEPCPANTSILRRFDGRSVI